VNAMTMKINGAAKRNCTITYYATTVVIPSEC
jgi:hypothetical protein